MRVLVAGGDGQLGRCLQSSCPQGVELEACDEADFDISDRRQTLKSVARFRPEVIVNAAAYTAVDKAEDEPAAAEAVNAVGAENLALAAKENTARLVYVSTDYVFDGRHYEPYRTQDPTGPLSVYGATKLDGEWRSRQVLGERCVVVRTSWLYTCDRPNFVTTMLRLFAKNEPVRVVCDQLGSPTWAGGLAEVLWALVRRPDAQGVFHWCDAGAASWYDFAVTIGRLAAGAGLIAQRPQIIPVRSDEFPQRATRPSYSVLDASKLRELLEVPAVHWGDNLERCLQDLERG